MTLNKSIQNPPVSISLVVWMLLGSHQSRGLTLSTRVCVCVPVRGWEMLVFQKNLHACKMNDLPKVSFFPKWYWGNKKDHFRVWLYVTIMSRTSFRVNLHSKVCLNVEELLAGNRRHIWSFSDSNEIRTHNHLVRKRTLNHLACWPVWPNGWVFVYELTPCGFQSRCCHHFRVFPVINAKGYVTTRALVLLLALCVQQKRAWRLHLLINGGKTHTYKIKILWERYFWSYHNNSN